MDNDLITPVLDRFNNLVDSLIADYEEFNMQEDTLGFLAEKTRNFISFNELTLNNVVFAILDNVDSFGSDFSDEVSEARNMVGDIFNNMKSSLDNILKHEDEKAEEHVHDHSHNHHHHYHIDIGDVQDDVNQIKACLVILKKVIGCVCDLILSTFKYSGGEIGQDELNNSFEIFKENISKFRSEFENI